MGQCRSHDAARLLEEAAVQESGQGGQEQEPPVRLPSHVPMRRSEDDRREGEGQHGAPRPAKQEILQDAPEEQLFRYGGDEVDAQDSAKSRQERGKVRRRPYESREQTDGEGHREEQGRTLGREPPVAGGRYQSEADSLKIAKPAEAHYGQEQP